MRIELRFTEDLSDGTYGYGRHTCISLCPGKFTYLVRLAGYHSSEARPKAALKSDMEYEVILVNVTKSPIERPQKAKTILFWEEKAAHTKNPDVGKS